MAKPAFEEISTRRQPTRDDLKLKVDWESGKEVIVTEERAAKEVVLARERDEHTQRLIYGALLGQDQDRAAG